MVKKISKEIKEELIRLFSKGNNATSALKKLKNDINYQEILTDKNKFPDYSYCYNLYNKYKNSLIDSDTDEEVLNKIFEKYNEETKEISAELAVCDNGITVSLCPPIARRVNKLENSGKYVFVESFSSNKNRIFLFLTYSEIGSLPLGVIIISNENFNMTRIGFSLFKEMLEENAFFGNFEGPEIFITDEYLSGDNVLLSIWPKSKIFLNVFHVLQNIWRWLSNSKNNISNKDRPLLFRDFYNLIYAENEIKFNTNFNLAKKSAKKYKNYEILLQNYYKRKNFWVNYCKPNYLKDINENIKYSFSTIRFIRNNMFNNINKLDFVQIIDFLIKKYFVYFEKRLLNISENKITDLFYSKLTENYSDLIEKIIILDTNIRLVPSKSKDGTYYIINTDLLTCTCANANQGPICKHVECVSTVLYQNTFKINCNKFEIRSKCSVIATGTELPTEQSINIENINKTIPETSQNVDNITQIQTKCLKVWQNITEIFEKNIEDSCEKFAPILNKISSKFDDISSVDDLKTSFNIFETVQTCKRKRIEDEDN